MNLLADESVERSVVESLRRDRHQLLQEADVRGSVLVTSDKDFGELVFRQRLVHSGVILLRLAGLANATKAEIVAEVCRTRAAELIGSFTVISPGQVRIRRRL